MFFQTIMYTTNIFIIRSTVMWKSWESDIRCNESNVKRCMDKCNSSCSMRKKKILALSTAGVVHDKNVTEKTSTHTHEYFILLYTAQIILEWMILRFIFHF